MQGDFEAWEKQFAHLDPFARLLPEQKDARAAAATARLEALELSEELDQVAQGIATPDGIANDKRTEQEWLRDLDEPSDE